MIASSASSLWRQRDFLYLWGAQTVSQIGSQVTFLALPLTAVLFLDASPGQMGVLTALGAVPSILFGLHAGAVVDRRRRRPILLSTDLGRAALLSLVPLAWLMGVLSLELLFAVALLVGLMDLFFTVAYQAFLPTIVKRSQLVDGNGKLELTRTAAEIAGPGLAGGLIQVIAAPVVIAIDACSYVCSAVFISRIRTTETVPPPVEKGRRLWGDVRDGLNVVLGDQRLRAIAGARVLLNFFNAMLEAVFILYVTRSLDLGAATIGVIFMVGSLGFVAGSLLPERLTRKLGLGWTTVAAVALVGASDLLVSVAAGSTGVVVTLLILAQFFFGVGLTVFNVNQASLRQAIVPAALQGRAAATLRFVALGPVPLGALLGGFLGGVIGIRETLFLAAAGELTAAAWLWNSPLRLVRELPDAEPDRA